MAPDAIGEIKATFHTKGRKGKQKKSISVQTNDPNHSVVKLTLLANVEVELSTNPGTVYFRNMKRGEQRSERVQLKNTSKNILKVSSINTGNKIVKVDLLNRSPEWPIELKPNESLDLLVSFYYQLDKPRFSKYIKIGYAGGEANEANFRIYATLKQEPKKPRKQTKTAPKNVDNQKVVKPESVETAPSGKAVPKAPAKNPPDFQPKGENGKPEGKDPD